MSRRPPSYVDLWMVEDEVRVWLENAAYLDPYARPRAAEIAEKLHIQPTRLAQIVRSKQFGGLTGYKAVVARQVRLRDDGW